MKNEYFLYVITTKDGSRVKDSRDRSNLLVFDEKEKAEAYVEKQKKLDVNVDLKIIQYLCSRSTQKTKDEINIKPFVKIVNKNNNEEYLNLNTVNNIVLRYTKNENDIKWYVRFYKDKSYTDSKMFLVKKTCEEWLENLLK